MARYRDPNDPSADVGRAVPRRPQTPVQQGWSGPSTPAYGPPRPPAYGPPRPPSYPTLPQQQYGQAGYRAPQFPGFRPTQEFAHDPTTANYERLMNFQIPYFMQPVQQTNYLAQAMPQYQQLQNTIAQLLPMLSQASPGESMMLGLASSLAGGGNADAYANEYRSQLKNEPFTGAEAEAYKTEFTDPIMSQQAQAEAQAMRELSDQGIDLSSGIAQAKLAEVRRGYQGALAQAQNQFAINANKLRSERQGLAFQAGLSAEELKQRGQSAALSGASGAASAWANRLGQMLETAGFGNSAAMDRARMGYGVDSSLRAEQYQNFGNAMQLAQIMSQLPSQRQAEALQLVQMADPSQVMDMTNAAASQRIAQANAINNAYGNVWGGLGSMFGYLGNMYNQPNRRMYTTAPGATELG